MSAAVHEIASADALHALAGKEAGVSDWLLVDQARIDRFADATGDHQWIHVDAERCRRESPFGTTIAHGFLTLSLLPRMLEQVVAFHGPRMLLNYGVNKVRFPAALPSGSRVRARIVLASVEDVQGTLRAVWDATVEREGGDKPVCAAEMITVVCW